VRVSVVVVVVVVVVVKEGLKRCCCSLLRLVQGIRIAVNLSAAFSPSRTCCLQVVMQLNLDIAVVCFLPRLRFSAYEHCGASWFGFFAVCFISQNHHRILWFRIFWLCCMLLFPVKRFVSILSAARNLSSDSTFNGSSLVFTCSKSFIRV
jgi:hypothetical protein